MSSSGSLPITALGACSGSAYRCEDRAEPAGEPSEGTVDSFAAAGSSIAGSVDSARGAAPVAEPAAGSVTIALEPGAEPQLVHGAAAAGILYTGRSESRRWWLQPAAARNAGATIAISHARRGRTAIRAIDFKAIFHLLARVEHLPDIQGRALINRESQSRCRTKG
jgi:hypothetical protein